MFSASSERTLLQASTFSRGDHLTFGISFHRSAESKFLVFSFRNVYRRHNTWIISWLVGSLLIKVGLSSKCAFQSWGFLPRLVLIRSTRYTHSGWTQQNEIIFSRVSSILRRPSGKTLISKWCFTCAQRSWGKVGSELKPQPHEILQQPPSLFQRLSITTAHLKVLRPLLRHPEAIIINSNLFKQLRQYRRHLHQLAPFIAGKACRMLRSCKQTSTSWLPMVASSPWGLHTRPESSRT